MLGFFDLLSYTRDPRRDHHARPSDVQDMIQRRLEEPSRSRDSLSPSVRGANYVDEL